MIPHCDFDPEDRKSTVSNDIPIMMMYYYAKVDITAVFSEDYYELSLLNG